MILKGKKMKFNEMNISEDIKRALGDMGFESPTPVQKQVIPHVLDGKDVLAQAPTGTGKTCAFGIPVINGLDTNEQKIQVLVLCPTRELVLQTEKELREVAKYNRAVKVVSIYGGQHIERQLSALRRRPQIIVGTTGRVMDHLRRRSLDLTAMRVLVLDEVDEMLQMGFKEDIDEILKTVPVKRQTVLLSATMPKAIVEISKKYQNDPVSVKTQHDVGGVPNIAQFYVKTKESEKTGALASILGEKNYFSALVFCNTKRRVDELCKYLNKNGFKADALHGDMKQRHRDVAMRKFRNGDTQILIATDVAARGIDVDNLEAVFNLDIPHDEEYYVHRIGRTARANKTGFAFTFVNDKQFFVIRKFENYLKSETLMKEYVFKMSFESTTMSAPPKLTLKEDKVIVSGQRSGMQKKTSPQKNFKQKLDINSNVNKEKKNFRNKNNDINREKKSGWNKSNENNFGGKHRPTGKREWANQEVEEFFIGGHKGQGGFGKPSFGGAKSGGQSKQESNFRGKQQVRNKNVAKREVNGASVERKENKSRFNNRNNKGRK